MLTERTIEQAVIEIKSGICLRRMNTREEMFRFLIACQNVIHSLAPADRDEYLRTYEEYARKHD